MQQIFTIEGMDCVTCAQKIEKGVITLSGVDAVTVDFNTQRLNIKGDVRASDVEARVKALGYAVLGSNQSTTTAPDIKTSFLSYLWRRDEMQYVFAALGVVVLALLVSLTSTQLSENLFALAGGIAIAPTLLRGLNTLRYSREFDINLLMGIAVIGAMTIGEYMEGLLVVGLFNIGEAMEGYVSDQARDSLKRLRDLTPKTAIRLLDGGEQIVSVETLVVDDRVRVNPHMLIPMDGEVLSGTSAVNQAPITGESVPVEKVLGDNVFAGTVNGQGGLEIRVTRLAEDNTLNRLIQMVEEADSERAPSQRIIEQFARWYTPLIIVLAVLTATLPPLLFDAPFWEEGASGGLLGGHGWLYRALALLIIGCPCALVLSAPVTVISSITSAARRGILIKGGRHLENLGLVKALAFDKTGTLTYGQPTVQTIYAVDGDNECLLKLAGAVEARSHHPIAKAVVEAADELDYTPADSIEALVGAGVRGNVNGRVVTVASARYMDTNFGLDPQLKSRINDAETRGETTLVVHDGTSLRGFIGVADQVRAESAAVIQQVKADDVYTIMLTGDNPVVADATASMVGVDAVHAELLPEDKVSHVRQLTDRYGQVAMVGDGVNDAPALATATVGIAMGGAHNAQAMETANVTLMSADLSQLPDALRIGRFARSLITQNVVLSIGIKSLFVVLALAGIATLWMAVLADVGMLMIVSLNGMRPLRA